MTDDMKTKEELIAELQDLRARFDQLSTSEAELRAAREALRYSELRFRSVAQSAVDAIVSSNSKDEIIFWNKAAEHIFGYSEEEVLGKPVTMLIPPRLREAHSRGVLQYKKTGIPALIGKTVEVPALRKSGAEFPIELSLSTWTAKGETFFTGIIRDISARKEAEKELQRRTEEARQRTTELEALIQMVAHDLKSPIITIAGIVRLLKKNLCNLPADEKREQLFSQLEASSIAVETFLKDLLDGLAVEATVPEQLPVRIEELIEEVARQHGETLEKSHIVLDIEIADSLPTITGDSRRLGQVLDNLICNAIRYMGNNNEPRIRIRAVQGSDCVIVSVSDNGIGIAKEYHGKIFERFFRAPGSGASGGSGLGLSIVKRIVQNHGGTVWVESEEGQGSIFSFSLPVYTPAS